MPQRRAACGVPQPMPTAFPTAPRSAPLICLSHLRWNFVFQRPQHLMLRCARDRPVYFVEEPIIEAGGTARLDVDRSGPVTVVVPRLPAALDEAQVLAAQRSLLDSLIATEELDDYLLWYYTPMALGFTDHLAPIATIYDCMDELSAFRGAPPALTEWEGDLLRRAGLVLTGGQSLYEAKRHQHPNIHPFPSSVDVQHFAQARRITVDPPDQRGLPRPRLGYFGVIDERMDIHLLAGVAAARPEWQIVMVGPVVKIDPASLPRPANIHY